MERIQAAIQKAKEARATGDAAAPPLSPPVVDQASAPAVMASPRAAAVADPTPLWQSLAPFSPDPGQMLRERIVSFERSDPAHMTFDMMRTKILRQMAEQGWSTLAITSPTSDCGKTMVALNLAFSFAQQSDSRTVLMDMDLRRPSLAKVLGLQGAYSMEGFLQGARGVAESFVRYGGGLAIGTSAKPARNPAELLHHPSAGAALAGLKTALQPRVIILDFPPMLTCDDMMAFLPNIDCVLLVAGAEVSTLDEVDKCERDLAEQGNVLGVVLNKCRYAGEQYGYYS
jgi:protein-tyrosine kinase